MEECTLYPPFQHVVVEKRRRHKILHKIFLDFFPFRGLPDGALKKYGKKAVFA
ncbi:MAG: hypothetical protein IK016_11520 [Lachnospiraceae bacterium]|nr:hypothetical protein [Lachnospiraceae bacterium]